MIMSDGNVYCKFEEIQQMAIQQWQVPYEGLSKRAVEILQLLAEGLSDQQIADQLYLSLNTVKWYNRQIYSKLGVGSRTQAIASAKDLRLLDNNGIQMPHVSTHNLPVPATPFIGRNREIAEVKQLLGSARLLTLTGVGGMGKTRLALRVASDVREDFADGIYFVDLAPLADYTLVGKAIAGVLGVGGNSSQPLLDTLTRAFAQREILLLMDNFEHVIESAPLVSDLLSACPRLKVLVTSRESLRLTGEQEYPVPPLSLPIADTLSIQTITDSEAGGLFVQRAQMILPRFEVTVDNAQAIAQICTRLDGLPLAIELAAARCKLLTPQALLDRLDSRLDALAGGSRDAPARQQSLRSTIEWSYNLLDEREKILFARLAVFRGGCSLEAIEAVCGQSLAVDVFDSLASLVDKSLVQQKETLQGEPRFVMLETIHEYAWERLEKSSEAELMRGRHAEYFVALAERAKPEPRLAQQKHWWQLLEMEQDNLRAILVWSLGSGDVAQGIRLASTLYLWWSAFGHHVEGRQWTEQLVARLDEAPVEYHTKFLIGAGNIAFFYDLDTAKRRMMQALNIARQLGTKRYTAWSLVFLSYTMLGETEDALAAVEEGLALFREMDYKPGITQALNIMGEIARFGGDDARARRAYEECLVVSQETGETRRIRFMLGNLAFIAQHEGDYQRARDLAEQALQLACEMNNQLEMADSMAALAGAIGMMGQPERAARLLGAWEAALERLGAFPQPADKPEFDRIIADMRVQLDPALFEAAWAEGRALTLEQAVADVMEETL
jgi:predicted ATPase/DNA-binding CsgD family transcriptional regulator